jgi:phage/plasmid-associated DNA primase
MQIHEVPVSTPFTRVNDASKAFFSVCCDAEQPDAHIANGTSILFVDRHTNMVKKLPQARAQHYMDVYMNYMCHAGELYASDLQFTSFPTPNVVECLQSSNCPLAFQIGPLNLADSSKLCQPRTVELIMQIALTYISQTAKMSCRHDIYAGFCAPRCGHGQSSLIFWMPSILRTTIEIATIRKGIHSALMQNTKLFSREDTPLFNTDQAYIDRIAALKSVIAVSNASGANGIVPLMWCADPVMSKLVPANELWPIVPVCMYGSLSMVSKSDNDDEMIPSIDIITGFDNCWTMATNIFMEHANRAFSLVDWSSTTGPNDTINHPSNVMKCIGCRPHGSHDISTYDTLGFVCSTGYAAVGQLVATPGAIPANIFDNCSTETIDIYTPAEMLKLISARRFDTTTTENIAVCAEIMHALKCIGEMSGATDPMSSALGYITTVARNSGSNSFSGEALAKHYSQNYMNRPTRSKRTIAYYAMLDSPQSYYRLLATRIWAKLTTMSESSDTVPLAEALATFLSLTHHVITSSNKNNEKLYVFKAPKYEEAPKPANRISALLSIDVTCGTLYSLLGSYKSRLGTLTGMINPSSNSAGPAITLLQAYSTAIDMVLKKLKEKAYKNSLVSEILIKLEQEQTYMCVRDRSLGDDIRLTGVRNGTLEIVNIGTQRKIFWRQATPDDMNDCTINAAYDTRARGSREWVTIVKYFDRFIANPRIRKWYLCQLAEAFYRENNKIALFIVGPSDCGKSMHLAHLKAFFGSGKMESINSNAFSDAKAGTDSPQPAITRAASAHIATVEETSSIIRNAIFKVIVGGNAEAPWRTLFQEGKSTIFRAKVFFAMNRLPQFECYEDSIFTRLAIFNPSTRYLDIGNKALSSDPKVQESTRTFPKDSQQSAKIMGAADAMLLYLMDHFDKWTNERGEPTSLGNFPEEMEEMRNRVRRQCVYAEFIAVNMLKSSNSLYANVAETLTRFRAYAKTRGILTVTEDSFQRSMDATLGTVVTDGKWYGWTLQPLELVMGSAANMVAGANLAAIAGNQMHTPIGANIPSIAGQTRPHGQQFDYNGQPIPSSGQPTQSTGLSGGQNSHGSYGVYPKEFRTDSVSTGHISIGARSYSNASDSDGEVPWFNNPAGRYCPREYGIFHDDSDEEEEECEEDEEHPNYDTVGQEFQETLQNNRVQCQSANPDTFVANRNNEPWNLTMQTSSAALDHTTAGTIVSID